MGLYSDDEWRAIVARRDAARLERLRQSAAERAARAAMAALPPLGGTPTDADTGPIREVRRAHGRGSKKR